MVHTERFTGRFVTRRRLCCSLHHHPVDTTLKASNSRTGFLNQKSNCNRYGGVLTLEALSYHQRSEAGDTIKHNKGKTAETGRCKCEIHHMEEKAQIL